MKSIRNLLYLAWIRTLPCLICGRTTGIEAAHTGRMGSGKNRLTGLPFLCASGTIERAGIRTTSSALACLSDATTLTSAPS